MTSEELIDRLEQQALLPAETIASLRQFVSKSLKIVTPESLAKRLVEKGRLTALQSKELLDQAPARQPPVDDFSLVPLDDPASLKQAKKDAKQATDAAAQKAAPAKAKTAAGPGANPNPAAATKAPAKNAARPSTKSVAKQNGAGGDFGEPLTGAGPLDDLFGPNLDGAFAGQESSPLGPAPRRSGIPKWVWIAGAGGAALVVFIVALLIALGRSNGDAEWQLAEKDFSAGSDQEAIAKFDAFLQKFPNHPRSSAADVYRGMARLRQAAAVKTDWARSLAIAREVLPKVVDRPDFPAAREGLNKLLPEMAVALAKQAKDGAKGPMEQRRRQAEAAVAALALAKDPRYTPDSQKPWAVLQAAENDVAVLARAVDRQTDLDRAAGEIRSGLAASNVAAAIARRDLLVENYPELRTDGTVEQLDQELAQGEAKSLKVDAERHKADTKPRPTPIVSTVVYAARGAQPAPKESPAGQSTGGQTLPGPAVALLTEGTAFWLSAADGAPLGRMFLGFDSQVPQAIAASGGTDFIVYDAVHQELARVAARSAATVWRQPLGGAIAAPPVLFGERLFAATRSGRLLLIDVETGDVVRSAQFNEPLRAPPAISTDRTTLYVASDRGNLFVLSTKDFHSSGATRLGYEQGAVTLAPIALGKYLVIVQDQSLRNTVLSVLAVGGLDTAIKTVQEIPLAGHVSTPPVVDNGRLFLATDGGELAAFALSGLANSPLARIADTPASAGDPQPRFLAVQASRLWIGGKGIAHYELAAAGAPRSIWQRLAETEVVEPPVLADNLLIVATKRAGVPGVSVAALDAKGGETKWETALAAPLAGGPFVDADAKTLRVIDPLAGQFEQTAIPAAPQEIKTAAPIATGPPAVFPAAAVSLGDGRFAIAATIPVAAKTGGGARLMFVDPKNHVVRLSPWPDAVASAPAPCGEGVIVIDRAGQVLLVNVETGQPLAAPFVPRIAPGAESWRNPAVVAGKLEAVVSDGRSRIYRLGVEEQPVPYLTALAEEPLTTPLVSDLAVSGEFVFAADEAGKLTAFTLADLKVVKNWPLGATAIWGPMAVGKNVLVATDRELFCFDSKPDLVWKKPLPAGSPVGRALAQGDEFVLASPSGIVWRIDRQSGEEKVKIDLGQPLASGPVVFDKHLVVAGSDGSLHFIAGR